jgi:hypothetical protein
MGRPRTVARANVVVGAPLCGRPIGADDGPDDGADDGPDDGADDGPDDGAKWGDHAGSPVRTLW